MRPCPPIQDALRRGNPPLSLHRTPPRPLASPRKHAGTISRQPPYSNFARMVKLRPKRLFLLYRARRVLFLALTKREWGAHPPWKRPPGGSQIPRPMGRTINQR